MEEEKILNRLKEKVAKSLSRVFSIFIVDKSKRAVKRNEYRQKINKFLNVQGPEKTAYGDRYIYHMQEGSDLVLKMLQKGTPCFLSRFVVVEMSAVYHFITSKKSIIQYSDDIREKMANNAGFFPATDESISRFSSEMIDALKEVDIMACWYKDGEEMICDRHCPDAKLVGLEVTNPLLFSEPWTQYLQGKKVLVIHPFAETIEQQYKHHKELFENPKMLPKFELKTLKAVQSAADNQDLLEYQTWFEALEDMCRQIDQIDFDIALIGAGAYGIFLGAHCKKLGKQAVHMGGNTQILFGITGRRFEEADYYNIKLNKYWTRPSEMEKPKGAEKIEGGCYW